MLGFSVLGFLKVLRMIWWRLNDEDDDPVWVFGRQIEQEEKSCCKNFEEH